MFCEKCGGEVRKEKKLFVCDKCGAKYGLDYGESCDDACSDKPENVVVSRFSSKKNIIIIALAGVLALGIGGTAIAIGASNSTTQSAITGIQLAERYLSELNYEQAVIEFQLVLEVEPMNVDAYLGLANSYIGLGDTEKALEVLHQGLERTGDARMQAKIDELMPKPSSTSSTSSIAEIDPREEKYSSAVKSMEDGDFENAISLFQKLSGYLDSDDLLLECKYLFANQKMQDGLYQEAISQFLELGDYKDCEANIEQCNLHIRYNSAVLLMNSGNYSQAVKEFETLGVFLDSNNKAIECKYQYALQLMNDGKYVADTNIFSQLGDYKQSIKYACKM